MRKLKLTLLMTALTFAATVSAGNPFFETFKTPHQTFPFSEIKSEHYLPAFEEAVKQHNK